MKGDRRGGNVYICSRVTDVETNLVMDGSIFSYGQAADKCGGDDKSSLIKDTGYPNFGTLLESKIKDLFKHQLGIVGALISDNTYGGSVPSAIPPVYTLGNGSTTSIKMKRLFDLNFLRYFSYAKDRG